MDLENPYSLPPGDADFGSMDPLKLVHEIGLMRYMTAKAIAEGAPPTVIAQLTAVTGRLVKDYLSISVKQDMMIHRDAAVALLGQAAGELAMEFSDVPGFEERIDRVLARLKLNNTPKQVVALIGRR